MLGDPWPEEPPDPFPEYDEPDPEADIVPDAPGPAAVDRGQTHTRPAGSSRSGGPPPALYEGVWALSFVFRIGIFAAALGPLLVAFRSARAAGWSITVVGLGSCAYGLHRYRRYRAAIRAHSSGE